MTRLGSMTRSNEVTFSLAKIIRTCLIILDTMWMSKDVVKHGRMLYDVGMAELPVPSVWTP